MWREAISRLEFTLQRAILFGRKANKEISNIEFSMSKLKRPGESSHAEGAETRRKGNHRWTRKTLRSLRALREIDNLFQGMADASGEGQGTKSKGPGE